MEIKNDNISSSLVDQSQPTPCFSRIKDFCKKKISLIVLSGSAIIITAAFVFAPLSIAALITTVTILALICFKMRNKIIVPTTNKDHCWFKGQDLDLYLNYLRKSHQDVLLFNFNAEREKLKNSILRLELERQSPTSSCTAENSCSIDSPLCSGCLYDLYGVRNIQDYNRIAYTMNINGSHWVLVFVDFEKKTIEYYDSLLNYGPHGAIANEFTELAQEIDFKFVCKMTKKIQNDGYQCGPWTLYFLEERLKNPEVDFNQLEVNEAQKMIAKHRKRVFKVNSSQSN